MRRSGERGTTRGQQPLTAYQSHHAAQPAQAERRPQGGSPPPFAAATPRLPYNIPTSRLSLHIPTLRAQRRGRARGEARGGTRSAYANACTTPLTHHGTAAIGRAERERERGCGAIRYDTIRYDTIRYEARGGTRSAYANACTTPLTHHGTAAIGRAERERERGCGEARGGTRSAYANACTTPLTHHGTAAIGSASEVEAESESEGVGGGEREGEGSPRPPRHTLTPRLPHSTPISRLTHRTPSPRPPHRSSKLPRNALTSKPPPERGANHAAHHAHTPTPRPPYQNARLAAGSGQRAVGSGQRAAGSGEWAVGGGRWAAGSGQWSMGSGDHTKRSDNHAAHLASVPPLNPHPHISMHLSQMVHEAAGGEGGARDHYGSGYAAEGENNLDNWAFERDGSTGQNSEE